MRKIIFGFLNPSDPELEGTAGAGFAVSFEDDFANNRCLSYEYPEEVHNMFSSWQDAGIVEAMESIFEFQKGREDFVKQYLEYNGLVHSQDFQDFLFESVDDEAE